MIQSDASFGAFMQQPAKPAKHEKSGGAGGSIIGILEVCESDFSKNLAAEEAQESKVEAYEEQTQANKITKTTNEQDVKYKTQEFKGLDKENTELNGDKETSGTELAAVMEYYGKIKDRCVAKPDTYEERTKRRNAEIEGLKQSLEILNEETAFVRRKRRGVRAQSAQLKEEIAEAQESLVAITKWQAERDGYHTPRAELEFGGARTLPHCRRVV